MYPAGSPPKADNWTLDTFLKAAEAESNAAERRLSAQSDQAKTLFRQVQQGFH